jgi:hypothetical protein
MTSLRSIDRAIDSIDAAEAEAAAQKTKLSNIFPL